MVRRIECTGCFKLGTNAEDYLAGWRKRYRDIVVKKPNDHGVTVNGAFIAMSSIVCDTCGQPIADGATAKATTEWNINREDEPLIWESQYSL
mgnify:CR=1 FL=1